MNSLFVTDQFENITYTVSVEMFLFPGDRPVVVQFAAKNATELANAAEMIAPYSDGVDLNCGCPQRYEYVCFFPERTPEQDT